MSHIFMLIENTFARKQLDQLYVTLMRRTSHQSGNILRCLATLCKYFKKKEKANKII